MTVATETAYAERLWTGVETNFAPGFSAEAADHVNVGYLDDDGVNIPLVRGVHFTVELLADNAVQVTPLALPVGSILSPLTLTFERVTPATQGVDFVNLAGYDPRVHELLHDRAAMRSAEDRSRQARTVTPFIVTEAVVDFRPRRLKAADPVATEDLATKIYVDQMTGALDVAAVQALRDETEVFRDDAEGARDEAVAAKNAAENAAALLESPDYGFFVDAPAEFRDYGSFA